jgi:hypothetical protein
MNSSLTLSHLAPQVLPSPAALRSSLRSLQSFQVLGCFTDAALQQYTGARLKFDFSLLEPNRSLLSCNIHPALAVGVSS